MDKWIGVYGNKRVSHCNALWVTTGLNNVTNKRVVVKWSFEGNWPRLLYLFQSINLFLCYFPRLYSTAKKSFDVLCNNFSWVPNCCTSYPTICHVAIHNAVSISIAKNQLNAPPTPTLFYPVVLSISPSFQIIYYIHVSPRFSQFIVSSF